jgi:hypothetical protein
MSRNVSFVFKAHLRVIFGGQRLYFFLECQRFAFFVKNNSVLFTFCILNSKLPFVLFGFCYFLVVFEPISFYFHFYHSDVRIKQNVMFRYRNKLKIRPQKQIGFVHVYITTSGKVGKTAPARTQSAHKIWRGSFIYSRYKMEYLWYKTPVVGS